jgi:hypothetical protein
MPELESASRRIPKATYTPITVDVPRTDTGSALLKFGFVRQLNLQSGEVHAVRNAVPAAETSAASVLSEFTGLDEILRRFEGTPMPSQLPSPNVFVKIPTTTLIAFGRLLVVVRQQANALSPAHSLAEPQAIDASSATGHSLQLVNQGIVATNVFEQNVHAAPIGMLNLERLEMTPVGIERGELIASIPLAPKEQTSVVQKEWSVTSQEFTSIVTDSLENYSETGVTENTDLAQSTTSQTTHSNQFNINASVSGSYGFVTASAATSFGSQNTDSASAKESRDHAVSTTRKASSRVKQEHKMTISASTVTGTSLATTRTLQNPSDTDPMRIDYFSMMRKWRVRLYRYGLRLTYDIAIPEPGGALREAYRDLYNLQSQLLQGFDFPVKLSEITVEVLPGENEPHYKVLADRYGVQVPPPPFPGPTLTPNSVVSGLNDSQDWHFFTLSFSVPDGTWITDVTLSAHVATGNGYGAHAFGVEGLPATSVHDGTYNYTFDLTKDYGGFLLHATGAQNLTFFFQWSSAAWVGLVVTTEPTPSAWDEWASAVWTALYNAAQTTFYANQQLIQAKISALQERLSNVDTLTLRREESDEIMKGVLRWLLGTGFDFMPPEVVAVFAEQKDAQGNPLNDLLFGVSFTGNDIGISSDSWSTMFQYQEMVKFINEAIEWENVLYFLYSYFWDVPKSWSFIRNIRHSDSTRQAFLRSGSARVVLPVRKGYEQAWTSFVDVGDLNQLQPPGSTPYMTIAQEIQNYDDTNYPGIPPANPGGPALAQQFVASCSVKINANSNAHVAIRVDSSSGFVIGARVVIDTFESNVQEIQSITAVPDATHVVVLALNHAHDGTSAPFPITQLANPGGPALADAQQSVASCSVKINANSNAHVAIRVDSSAGFLIGARVVIDTFESNVQEVQSITAVPDATHIVVLALNHAHDGTSVPFPIIQQGEQGLLIAEWYEYTPSSGTDIAVTSNLSGIA